MSATLTYNDSISRVGYTKIDGQPVMQHTCNISADDPTNMNFSSIIMNQELYKANRSICRADRAEFEDLAYALQEQYLPKEESEVTE